MNDQSLIMIVILSYHKMDLHATKVTINLCVRAFVSCHFKVYALIQGCDLGINH